MPFLAQRADSLVIPEEVGEGETVYCPACEGRMRPRDGSGSRARHFMHIDNLGSGENVGCEGIDGNAGESATHRKLKSFAVSGLRGRFEGQEIAKCAPEVPIQVYRGELDVRKRQADALIEFRHENRFFGKGVIVEVQYRNTDKDIPDVTSDYLAAGYSVFWADEKDFSKNSFDLARFDQAFNDRSLVAFAPYYVEPEEAELLLEGVKYDLGNFSFLDPRPDCDHAWHTAGMTNFCMSCGTSRRTHDQTDRTMYLPLGKEAGVSVEVDSPFQ